jgi:hypothetical protein
VKFFFFLSDGGKEGMSASITMKCCLICVAVNDSFLSIIRAVDV